MSGHKTYCRDDSGDSMHLTNVPGSIIKQQRQERYYFEKFSSVYPLPAGRIDYGDKPDVIIAGTPTIRIEITKLYVSDGTCRSSALVQSKLRAGAVSNAHQIYKRHGGADVFLTFELEKRHPIDNPRMLAGKLSSLGPLVAGGDNGQIRDALKEIPALNFGYLAARDLQYNNQPDPKFPDSVQKPA